MKIELLCKDERIVSELPKVDPRVRAILLDAACFLAARGFALLVTCLLRTREEQRTIFERAVQLGLKEPERSPHEFGRAADIRTHGIPEKVIAELVTYINHKYPYDPSTGSGQAHRKCAIRHNVGGGDHLHIQVGWRSATSWGVPALQSL
ncbi:MAG: hypothetical protein KDH09_16755, partial [Chrysiogenetes bacterium]|nr:hypothetical protein [Chrysiogenetes bacterium]